MSKPDWSRPLPRPLTIPTVMKLSTLADVRDLVEKHLPRTVPPQAGVKACLKSTRRGGARREGLARNLRGASPGTGA